MPDSRTGRSPDKALSSFVSGFFTEQGLPPVRESDATVVPADGSERVFFRFQTGPEIRTIIAMVNPPATPFARRENIAYLEIGRHLRACGVPVPEIHRWNLDRGWFLMEDLGDRRLQDAADDPVHAGPLYDQVVTALFHMQTQGVQGFDTTWCCQTERYDRRLMRQYESDYFKEAFLSGYAGVTGPRPELDRALDHLASQASRADARFFLHRDFQSRNILIDKSRVGFVDWQGGRVGPLGYDLASLLIDPYAGLSPSEEGRLYRLYLERLRAWDPSWAGPFEDTYPYLALQRNLQILGAFAFLSRVRGKPFFETYIPPAFRSLKARLRLLADPRLRSLSVLIESMPRPWEGD